MLRNTHTHLYIYIYIGGLGHVSAHSISNVFLRVKRRKCYIYIYLCVAKILKKFRKVDVAVRNPTLKIQLKTTYNR